MARTKIDLARQAVCALFTFGASSASGEGKVTIENGTQPVSNLGLDVKGSASVGGDLTIGGNLNVTGSINESSVTNLQVTDKTITLNKGGAGGSDSNTGLLVEAGAAVVAALKWISGKWTIGDGTTQVEIVDLSTAQTLSNKTLAAPAITGAGTAVTQTAGDNSTKLATTAFVTGAIGAATHHRACTVTGTQDGSNTVFTIGAAVLAGSEQVFLNGQLLTPGGSNDYVISTTTVTFQSGAAVPAATDALRIYGVY